MANKKFSFSSYLLVAVFLLFGLTLSLHSTLAAWVAPSAVPPASNIDQPLNVGSTTQSKAGILSTNGLSVMGGFSVWSNDLYVDVVNHRVGIGDSTPSQKLDVTGIITAYSGFRVNNTAGAAGSYLRSNGSNFVVGTIQASDVPTLNQSTTGNAGTATALSTNPTNCPAGQYPLGITAYGVAESCSSNISTASALSTNPANCPAGQYPLGIAADGTVESCTTVSASGVTGSGSTSYLSRWTSATSLGNSVIYDNATNVGIGTASPSQKLDVYGVITASSGFRVNNTAGLAGSYLRSDGTNLIISGIQASDVPTLNQNTSGNAATASALSANPANCPAGQYPLGIGANGAVESCTANATTASALSADPANCPAGQYPLGVAADGSVQSCTAATALSGGDINRLPKWTSASTIGLSDIYNSGGRIGINRSDPNQTLDVLGIINAEWGYRVGNTAGVAGSYLRSNGTNLVISGIQASDVPILNQNTTGTASALSANPTNCPAGQYPLGVAANGAAESCTTVPAAGISGSGTTNYLSKWTSGTGQGNSVIYETAGGYIGIGKTNPGQKLDVNGRVDATNFYATPAAGATGIYSSSNGGIAVYAQTSGSANAITSWNTGTGYDFYGYGKSRFGSMIGIARDPSYTLDVNGDINYTGTLRQNGNSPIVYVNGGPKSVTGAAASWATADCPAGKVITGGGCSYAGSTSFTHSSNYPQSTTRWYCSFYVNGGATVIATAYALCM